MLVLSRDLRREPQRIVEVANNLYNHLNYYLHVKLWGFPTHGLRGVRMAGSHLCQLIVLRVEASLIANLH